MNSKNLFRDKALEKLTAPEEFDIPLRIVNIRSWIYLLLLFAIMSSLFLWLTFSKVNQEVNSRGMIVKEENIIELFAPREGFVEQISIKSSDDVRKGEVLLSLVSTKDKQVLMNAENNSGADQQNEEIISKSLIRTAVDGKVIEVITYPGNYVRTGDKLLTLEKEATSEGNHFEITGFIPGRVVNSLHSGNMVLISPRNIDVKEFGYLKGKVINIADYPVSPERLLMLQKKNPFLFEDIHDKYFEIRVVPLTENNQLIWTSNKTPVIKFINGTQCDLKIILSTRNMFSYMVE